MRRPFIDQLLAWWDEDSDDAVLAQPAASPAADACDAVPVQPALEPVAADACDAVPVQPALEPVVPAQLGASSSSARQRSRSPPPQSFPKDTLLNDLEEAYNEQPSAPSAARHAEDEADSFDSQLTANDNPGEPDRATPAPLEEDPWILDDGFWARVHDAVAPLASSGWLDLDFWVNSSAEYDPCFEETVNFIHSRILGSHAEYKIGITENLERRWDL